MVLENILTDTFIMNTAVTGTALGLGFVDRHLRKDTKENCDLLFVERTTAYIALPVFSLAAAGVNANSQDTAFFLPYIGYLTTAYGPEIVRKTKEVVNEFRGVCSLVYNNMKSSDE